MTRKTGSEKFSRVRLIIFANGLTDFKTGSWFLQILIFMWEAKFQKNYFIEKYDKFFKLMMQPFSAKLGGEYPYVCYDLRTDKEGIYVK